MEKKLDPELSEKLDALKAKFADDKQLSIEELNTVSGGAGYPNMSQREREFYDILMSVLNEDGPQALYDFTANLFGEDVAEGACGSLNYDEYDESTVSDIVYRAYHW
ncbi:MAG: bacteriocin [Clostridia bacterium]|nr:bacteriocin [Clostridia bacterium]